MIQMNSLKPIKVAEAKSGDLILFPHAKRVLAAIKVTVNSDDSYEKESVIAMPLQAPHGVGPVLYTAVGHEKCLLVGKAVVVWDGRASSISHDGGNGSKLGSLLLLSSGPAIAVAWGKGAMQKGFWCISEGVRKSERTDA